MEIIELRNLKKGMIFKIRGSFFECLDANRTKPSFLNINPKTIDVVVKKLKTGVITEHVLLLDERVELVTVNENKMTFLYDNDENLCFMDPNTYDMLEVSKAEFKWEVNFLTANSEVFCLVCENEIIKINLPDEVCLTISSCDAIDFSKSYKNAVCETGLKVNVPLFTNAGERIYVSTLDGRYKGRAK